MTTRRELFKGIAAAAVAVPFSQQALPASPAVCASSRTVWVKGIEGQRKADLGDGTYLNPIVAGDHPDPTVLKDGDDYYMTFSSFHSYPGLVIWHSTDLVNWSPIGPTLHKNLGDIWAVDLCKHKGRYFIYIPANPTGKGWSIFVIWADHIAGPWSEPIDLDISGSIDPGHVVGEDGRRYLFVNGIRKIRLTDDGLSTDGELVDSYRPWRYPDHWITENFAPEGPKLLWRDGWLYLITAVGGTAGPPTGHMVIAARSRSVHGPWEHCPSNPLVRTQSNEEPWWSRGHATVVEGPAGDWWMVYHGYENGFRTLGRQTLLEPVEWTADGWLRAKGGDLSRPLPKPGGGKTSVGGYALSGGFAAERLGFQWCFHQPRPEEMQRAVFKQGALRLAATALRARMATIKPEEIGPMMERVLRFMYYSHGTHVAGIAAQGNPAVRLVSVRSDFSWKTVPPPITDEVAKAWADGFRKSVAYLQASRVRVVNMSWGLTPAEVEYTLEANGIGADAAERKAIAAPRYELMANALREAIASAPEILFVTAAGNSDSDVDFARAIPAGIAAPNLICAGAVDEAGGMANFTSLGKGVRVFTNGVNVESYIPGGARFLMSGTSMASPQVTNLAAKLFALDANLTPEKVIELITRGAASLSPGAPLLMDEKKSIEILRGSLH